MRRALWFLVVLLAGLGGLALAGYGVLMQTTGAWFERDLELRTRLAVFWRRARTNRACWC